jgi:penicillin amidase
MANFFMSLLPAGIQARLKAVKPPQITTRERLADFPINDLPLERPAVIRWNDHHIPYIETETDRDLAVCLGLVHIHLRGGHIALFRHFYDGRLAEAFGPLAANLDHALRILDYGHPVEAILKQLPDESRDWLDAFIDGVNCYQERMTRLPPDMGLLGIKPEPADINVLLKGGRLAATDFTWLTHLTLLEKRGTDGYAELWNRTMEAGENPPAGVRPNQPQTPLADLLLGAGRAGSNSVVVAPHRSASGSAMIASDPHLGLSLPNLWFLVGLRSPSYNVVGYMIPGLPVIFVGRSPHMAWGGTNMRAASSDLYDVANIPSEQIKSEEVVIRCKGWFNKRRTVRRTPFGPIISDAKVIPNRTAKPVALKWVGHEATDEVTPFLKVMEAKTPESFRQAFATYGVSGHNILFADVDGNIGQVMAVRQPIRKTFPKDDPVLDATDPSTHWQGFVTALDLPFVLNPPTGVYASANNRPEDTEVPIGFTFGSDDRIRRLYQLLARRERLTIDDLTDQQTDTKALDAQGFAAGLSAEIAAIPGGVGPVSFIAALDGWDGDYAADAAGPVAFETLLYHLVPALYGGKNAKDLPDLLSQWTYLTKYLLNDLKALPEEKRYKVLAAAVEKASRDAAKFPTWGDMHRLKPAHILARLPIIGKNYVVGDQPIGGSRQTPMKMAHDLVNDRHNTTFGSMARHISDMSDLDHNWFCILGGQDGWFGSDSFADQIPLWNDRKYIRMPLRPETVAAEFPIVMQLTPKEG